MHPFNFTIMKIIKEPFNFLIKYRFPLLAFMIYLVTVETFLEEACPVEIILGVPCPSCGITRAWLSAISFDFPKAFYFHPLFLLVIPVLIIFIYKDYKYINKIYNCLYFWIFLIVIILLTYVLRMIFQFPNEVLKINENSLLQIIIRFIKSLFD